MTLPMISVVVPCRNERQHIESVVTSILAQQDLPGPIEILIADGRSDDGTRELLDRLATGEPRLRVIDNPGRIVSTGLNAAITEAKGQVIVRMDAHTVYADDYVAHCVRALSESGADNVGGPALTTADSYVQRANSLAFHSPFAVGGARFHDPGFEGWVDTVTYGCWRKDTLVKLGMFDEELVCNQDDELNLRTIRAGGRIWQTPMIRSWYAPRASIGKLLRQYAQYGYWKVRVIQKHRIPAAIRHLVPGGFVAMLLVLGVLAPFLHGAAVGFLALLGTYLIANLCATLITCRRAMHWKYIPIMPIIFAAYHFGYGWGFLKGMVDFMVLRRGAGQQYSRMTR